MPQHGKDHDHLISKSALGSGSFSDQYDNQRSRSVDHDQNPGAVTPSHMEDEIDFKTHDFFPDHGEAYDGRHIHDEGPRVVDLGRSADGTEFNRSAFYGRGPKGWKRSDEKLREIVNEVLLHSHEVDPSHLEVEVKEACVYLKGSIKSKGMRRVAEDLVGSIPGVVDVFTQLRLEEKNP